ncbi:hypothetical protein BABINDRAFT_10081 [Babjeviella inositovora NRRL Y-12698]|uniref:ATP synthase subunit delta, mitochondrial n=1 Tax=Babjeviella inositovora NRRL Y-12698 TaxID=984486 RepID=A0A1E3QIA8_9ASCO|nr:uncharacterized protein BABINDRAFT_10081 [Babjeviella inositovora NRRL Y-12698]ODQ77435.1 hypothetical protein BABINDRAFT_10081 [Babjeviella inositovora NRRL Y-12698]
MFRQQLSQLARRSVRSYAAAAEAATSDVLKLSLTSPHQAIFNNKAVKQVNIPSISGELGILASHVPIIEQLVPGLVEVTPVEGETEQYFVSGGVATMQPDNTLSITAIEAYKAEDFSADEIRTLIAAAQKNVSSADEAVAAEAAIQLEVLEVLQTIAK